MAITIQDVLDFCRTWPVLNAVLGNQAAGYSSQPTLTFANNVVQEIIAPGMNWKWNRVVATPFYVNGYQQDYCTNVTDIGWLENATRLDMGNPTAKPFPVEVVRDLMLAGAEYQPMQLAWIPNSQAVCGTWAASTTFTTPVGKTSLPTNPLTQIRDSNGNIQVVTTYGTTGGSQPTWATTPGQTTTDGSVVWTCINPAGSAFRLGTLPPRNGNLWQITVVYQKKPTTLTALNNTWSGIPDEYAYVYRQGFLAHAFKAADDPRYVREYEVFQAMIQKALGSADRERDEVGFYPAKGIMGGPINSGGFPWFE